MSKIGIMGGTFNPIHNGHIQIAKAAMEEYHLDEIRFIPAGQPPHKQVQDFVSNEQRKVMTKLAIAGISGFTLCSLELDQEQPSYSYRTLSKLQEMEPGNSWYFILGEDSLYSFPNWVHPEVICSIATILVAVRKEDDTENGDELSADYDNILRVMRNHKEKYQGHFQLLHTPQIPVSSSMIRQRIRCHQSVEGLINQEVEAYIMKENIYQKNIPMISVDDLQKKMEKALKPSRYQHTLGVMYTAAALAMRYDSPMEQAMIAGVLHDCAKCISDEERIDICRKNHIEIKEIEMQYPHLLHAKAGAYLAKEKYHVMDADILHAIRVHTTGCPQMNLLDKIIYAADYIEPNREKAPRLNEVRNTCFQNLDRGILMILEDTVQYLGADESMIDRMTLDTYEYYKERVGLDS